ncbi:hypothetical protein NHX12_010355 [Muraenolepis orangiensis]|uniref:Gem-associated protein 5 n=1 Tax=Muraenolepis orangiensis TaxID=630683 RepID=A0A9Q0I8U3_9TELE|nr:hypothetical protein NHX12_010355 [Muraenolepis orangiensis]
MHERVIPASPNWYCGRCSDTNQRGVMGFGARNTVHLLDGSGPAGTLLGSLCGHKERVSGFSFCRRAELDHLCASSSDDGTVKFWDSNQKVLIKEHSSHQATIVGLHWSPSDHNLVVSGDEKGVVVCYWFNTGDTSSFLPLPKTLFSLSCSPHAWNILALGYKHGMILLVDVSKKGEVLQRLRGHEDEIHALSWSPRTSPQDQDLARGQYLASGSRDQTIRIWNTHTGRGVTTLKLPSLKKRGGGPGGGAGGVKDRLWLSVHWPDDSPSQLLSTCFSGELVLWDLGPAGEHRGKVLASGDQNHRWKVLGSGDQNHSRIVFNMSSVCLAGGQRRLLTTSMDREIKCWDLSSLECVWTLSTLGGSVYSLSFSPVAVGRLALGGADQMIRSWDTLSLQNPYQTRTFWQGIRSKITALVWHPSREASLAFGTDDGKVGIYDAFSTKPPQISSSYHQKTVYRLSWGPPLSPLEGESCSLYSCGGEGLILQHAPRSLASPYKMSPHSDFSWKPDKTLVAIGNEDGSVDVYRAPDLKQLCSIQQQNKMINTLQWYPALGPQQNLEFLLASGSSSAKVFVHDLRAACESPTEPPAVISEAFRTLGGHMGKITGLSWSPHHPAHLVSVSYDRTAQVWDVLKGEGLVNYRGHGNRVMCVEWSPVDPDVVWTGADDFTVHEWKLSRQDFTSPPKGKKPGVPREKSKQKKSNMAASGQREAGPPSANGEREAKVMKRRKPRSILPLSTTMDHRSKEDLLEDCVTLATVTHCPAPPAGCVPGQGEHLHLGLFSDRHALHSMFLEEEEAHLAAGHPESVVYLRLWSGDLEGALRTATERGELNDHLMAMAPTGGYSVWVRAVQDYVKQLCLQDQHLKAASFLLSINKLHEALELLHSHKMYREAVALARSRLPDKDQVLKDLYVSWAAALERDGHLSAAAKCYLAAGADFDAAKVLSKKSDAPSLRAAATLARLAGDLLVHRLCFCVAEMLSSALTGSEDQSSHPWARQSSPGQSTHASGGPDTIQDRVRLVWQQHFGVTEGTGVESLLKDLASVEKSQLSTNSSPNQLCSLILPHGDAGVFSRRFRKILVPVAMGGIAAHASLQAVLNYHFLYDLWWSHGPCASETVTEGTVTEGTVTEESVPKESVPKGSEVSTRAVVLLSEPHAAYQNIRNAMADIQGRLAALMLHHSLVQRQENQEENQQEPAQRGEEQDSLLSLSNQMTRYQMDLAHLPDTVKMFSHPDVVECSLLVLHLARRASLVSEDVQITARGLLRRYASSPDTRRASRRFLKEDPGEDSPAVSDEA